MAIKEITPHALGMAFLVVTLAGLSTAIGALVVYFPRFVRLATRRVLASSLGISAGVMIYVSFVEIYFKSKQSFDNFLKPQIDDEERRIALANTYATLSFFLGVLANCVSFNLTKIFRSFCLFHYLAFLMQH